MKITWIWSQLLSWVSVHFARHHIGWEKFISTQRTDRTNVNRKEKFWSKFVKYCKENDWNYSSIQSRYDAYNEMFWEGN